MTTPVDLPSRYEDLRPEFRAQLRPNRSLINEVKTAYQRMRVSGGVRFLPVFGLSGAGKTSAARELATHLPDVEVHVLPREVVEGSAPLETSLPQTAAQLLIAVVDQFEENVARREDIPTRFVEALSRLDRSRPSTPVLFIWLTTSREFQAELAAATSRNSRLLARADFELEALPRSDWPDVIEETFEFHNEGSELADFEVLRPNLEDVARKAPTLGTAIEETGDHFSADGLQDLSEYQVIMLWPVTDGQRLANVRNFTNPRAGYRLDWNAFYRALNVNDQQQLPLDAYNKARLYFDVRLVPIQAADLRSVCLDLTQPDNPPSKSYLDSFSRTHLFTLVNGTWDPDGYRPMKDHGESSQRAKDARAWYPTVNTKPTVLGHRLAACLTALDLPARAESEVKTPHSRVVADVLVNRPTPQGLPAAPIDRRQVILELKAYAPDGTTPSVIAGQIRSTLKKHAQLAGYVQRS
ncbi:ATP-binding protein [Kineococcus sp. R8]|uniref:ATP-binding protein n=1 Tax=Kineococcus siccus TaxID=2696567 RepID=UPI0014120FEA|nr:ATP-binding protein [Kineococcus siccus]NAZ82924.1 ATP-binding protein [Kineococcus siccus]